MTVPRHNAPRRKASTKKRPAPKPAKPDFDVVFAGDFSVSADAGLRVAGEAAAAAEAGYRVALLHCPWSGEAQPIAPELDAAVIAHDLTILAPSRAIVAELAVLHLRGALGEGLAALARITASRIVAVANDVVALGLPATSAPANLSLALVHASLKAQLPPAPGLRVEREAWPVIAMARPEASSAPAERLRLGALIPANAVNLADRLKPQAETHPDADIILWTERGATPAAAGLPDDWQALDTTATSVDWFLRKVDAVIGLDRRGASPACASIVANALAAGKPVVLPAPQAEAYRDAVIAADVNEAVPLIRARFADAKARAQLARKAITYASRHHGFETFAHRLEKLIGPALKRRRAATGAPHAPRVIFLPKGGVGLGHVARSLAVARRAEGRYEPVFATLSEQAGLIEGFGFRSEYLPSAAYTGLTPAEWEPWFQSELEALVASYKAEAIVFDGSDPPDALVAAVAARSGCKLAWMRRGMWEPGYDPSLHNATQFDLIIEPGEIAEERDRGATALRRTEAQQVEPVTLLDRSELLSREKAASALGLDPARPAVLLQLGSGENRDIIGALDTIIAQLGRYPELQIAVAEWANSAGALNLWKGVKVIKGAPLSLYYNAFDFSIAAAGYNTFHEAMNFGLPCIFVPNTATGMDDQQARAQFAQDKGAAIEMPQTDLIELPHVLALMMQQPVRAVMRQNCFGLAAGNGAEKASALIAGLVN